MADRKQELLDEAKERYRTAVDGWSEVYDEAARDIDFAYDIGEGQWPDDVRRARGSRPTITVNKIQKFLRQVRADQMMNRARIKVIPVDDRADVQTAELYNGLIRQIEYQSNAEIAYDTAYGCGLACSVGYFMLDTGYAGDDSFDQDIYIKRILDPLSVHFDPQAQEFTLEDARYCFIETSPLTRAEYEDRYGDDEEIAWDGAREVFGDWLNGDRVRVCKYYYKKPVSRRIAELSDGRVVEWDKELSTALSGTGLHVVRDRVVETHEVWVATLSGAKVLDETRWPGKYIPVIPVFGDEIVSGGKRHYLSLARGARGPQQMYNYWVTAATETVALTPKSPFIIDHRQIKGYEREWNEANIKNTMYIRYNAVPGLNKPAREPQGQVPSGIMAMLQSTAMDIEDHLGRYEAALGKPSNERSGKAIQARVAQSDKGSYQYVDNLTRAIIYCGKQLIDLIPKIYDSTRAIQIMGETGEPQTVRVNEPGYDPITGTPMRQNDLSVGKYDLIASMGASYSSKRQEMVQMMIEAMQYAPTVAPVIAPLIFKYSDWPGAQEVAEELKREVEQQRQMAQMEKMAKAGGMSPLEGMTQTGASPASAEVLPMQ